MTTEIHVERKVVIASKVGLHARPAATVAKAAGGLPAVVRIAKDGDPVDARSLLSLISLGAEGGDTVILSSSGEGAQEAVDTLAELLVSDLDHEG
jgi:phosphocarrier protein HPr